MTDKVVEKKTEKPEKLAATPAVDLASPETRVDTSRTAIDTAALVKQGVVSNLTIVDGKAQTLTPEAVAKDAELLHAALTKTKMFGLSSSPDAATVGNILDPTDKKDRVALEAKYEQLYGTKLRDDVKKYLGSDGVAFRTVESMLNRNDNRTNFGGNLEVAIETTKVDPEKGNRLLRAAVGSLNSDQISQMATDLQKVDGAKAPVDLVPANATEQQRRELTLGLDIAKSGRQPANETERAAYNAYQKAYVDRVISETPGLTDANRQVLGIMTQGADHRSADDIKKMANIALGANDLKMFADAVNGDTPAAIAARKQIGADAGFVKQFNEKFVADASQTQADVANDLLKEGKVSIPTIIKGDSNILFGLLDNPKNIDLAASSSTAKEQKDFSAGKELSLSGRKPANEQEAAALEYYNKVQQAMTDAGMDKKQRAITEDEIAHGGKTLISRLAELDKPSTLGFIGGGHTTHEMMKTIENMTPQDWKLLQDPAYKRDLLASTWTYEKNEDVNRRMQNLIEAKAAAPNFEASQGIKRNVWEVYKDTQSGGATERDLASAIASMSPADAAKYKSDADYRKRIDDIVQNNLYNGAQDLAKSVLTQVAQTGKPAELSTLQQIQKNTMDGASPRQQIDLVEKLLADPKVREGLAKPWQQQTDEEKKIKAAVMDAIPTAINPNHPLFKDGHVPLGDKVAFGVPINQLYPDIARLPEAQRAQFQNLLNDSEKQILNNVIAQGGQEKLEDRMRAIVVSGGDYKDIQGELSKLTTDEQKKALINAYENKYHSNLSNDYMPLVDAADKVQFQNYLRPNGDGNQTAFDHAKTSDDLTRPAFDASAQTVERALQIEKGMLTQFQALHKQLPQEMQEKINTLITNAVDQNRAAPIEEIKALGKAAVDVAAVVATIYTLGGSAALAASIRAGEAAATVISRATVERTAAAVLERQAVAPVAETVLETGTTRLATGAAGDTVIAADRAATVVEPVVTTAKVVEPVATAAEVTEPVVTVAKVAEPVVKAAEVTEPVVTAAKVAEPIATAAEVTEPVVTAAKVAEPIVTAAEVTEPVVTAAKVAEPIVTAAEVTEPVVTAAKVAEPIVTAAEVTEPVVTAAKVAEPIATAAEVTEPVVTAAKIAEPLGTAEKGATILAGAEKLVKAIEPSIAATTTIAAAGLAEVATRPEPPKQDVAPHTIPTDKLMALATVRRGEGPFQSAERILSSDGKRHSIDEVMALTRALQHNFSPERNGNHDMKGLKVNYQFITKDNFAAIIADVKNPQVKAQLMKFAMAS
jgi:hypothetical protein